MQNQVERVDQAMMTVIALTPAFTLSAQVFLQQVNKCVLSDQRRAPVDLRTFPRVIREVH